MDPSAPLAVALRAAVGDVVASNRQVELAVQSASLAVVHELQRLAWLLLIYATWSLSARQRWYTVLGFVWLYVCLLSVSPSAL